MYQHKGTLSPAAVAWLVKASVILHLLQTVDRIPLEAWYHKVDPLPKKCVMRLWFIHSFRDIEERLYEHCLQVLPVQIVIIHRVL